jgi:hypothetical protein
MADEPDEIEDNLLRQQFFEKVQHWAEENLSGERRDPALPLFFPFPWYPAWRELRVGMRSVEERLQQLSELVSDGHFKCPLVGDQVGGEGVSQLLVGPLGAAERDEGIREIRDFTRDAEQLVVVDPYVYAGEFSKAARIGSKSLTSIHIVFSSHHGNTKSIKDGLSERAYAAQVRLTDHDTDKIHDRVWIADGKRGLVVGTSFGGLGTRAAFLLPLPIADCASIWEFLQTNGMLRGDQRRPMRMRSGGRRGTR